MDIDRKLLTVAELAEYDRLVSEEQRLPRVYATVGSPLPGRVRVMIACWAVGWVAALLMVGWWTFATSERVESGAYRFDTRLMLLFAAVMVGGCVFPVVWQSRDRKRIQARLDEAQARIDGFLDRVRYDERVKKNRSGGATTSLRRSQHSWYGGHSELNWRHREQGELLGFDNADDYVSNFLESE